MQYKSPSPKYPYSVRELADLLNLTPRGIQKALSRTNPELCGVPVDYIRSSGGKHSTIWVAKKSYDLIKEKLVG